jgi:hypothetical protein
MLSSHVSQAGPLVTRRALVVLQSNIKDLLHFDLKASLYNIVWGQCSDALQTRIESHPDHAASRQDGLALLVIIKKVTHTFEEHRKTCEALCELQESFTPTNKAGYDSTECRLLR